MSLLAEIDAMMVDDAPSETHAPLVSPFDLIKSARRLADPSGRLDHNPPPVQLWPSLLSSQPTQHDAAELLNVKQEYAAMISKSSASPFLTPSFDEFTRQRRLQLSTASPAVAHSKLVLESPQLVTPARHHSTPLTVPLSSQRTRASAARTFSEHKLQQQIWQSERTSINSEIEALEQALARPPEFKSPVAFRETVAVQPTAVSSSVKPVKTAQIDVIEISDSDDDVAPTPSTPQSSGSIENMFSNMKLDTLADHTKRTNDIISARFAKSDSGTAGPHKLRKLTAEENSTVDQTLALRADAVVVDDFNMTVNGRHVQCLREGCWLNDEVMNFYFELLRARSECLVAEKKGQKCHFFNTFFYTQLAKTVAGYCYKNVQRWTRRLKSPLFTHDVVFAPIHVHDSHWCLAVMRLREKKIEYWDSLSGRDEGCLQNLLQYLTDEAKDKSPQSGFNPSEWTLELVKNVPKQTNGIDCGVFTCKMADYLSEGFSPAFKQADMPYFRRRMLLEIRSKLIE